MSVKYWYKLSNGLRREPIQGARRLCPTAPTGLKSTHAVADVLRDELSKASSRSNSENRSSFLYPRREERLKEKRENNHRRGRVPILISTIASRKLLSTEFWFACCNWTAITASHDGGWGKDDVGCDPEAIASKENRVLRMRAEARVPGHQRANRRNH